MGVRLKNSFLNILTGSDLSRRRLPLMSATSPEPGPVLWLTACGHGDEVGGIVVVQEIFKRLRKELLRGRVCAFPLMNPIGFETGSRDVTLSDEDLNRSFPGSAAGSLGQRIAGRIFSTILDTSPDLVLDLHNDWMKSMPYVIIDHDPGPEHEETYEKTRLLAEVTGLLRVVDTEHIKHCLTFSAILNDIPALTLELGGSKIVHEKSVEYGVGSVWKVLAHLGMVRPADRPLKFPIPPSVEGRVLWYWDRPLSSASGIIRYKAAPGDFVVEGQKLAKTYSAFGKLKETIVCMKNGIVLGHSDYSVTFPGAPVMAFGVLER